VRVPQRFISPRPLRLAVERALEEPSIQGRAQELAAWARSHDTGAAAGVLVEELAIRRADRHEQSEHPSAKLSRARRVTKPRP
jgi:hypothetical protein